MVYEIQPESPHIRDKLLTLADSIVAQSAIKRGGDPDLLPEHPHIDASVKGVGLILRACYTNRQRSFETLLRAEFTIPDVSEFTVCSDDPEELYEDPFCVDNLKEVGKLLDNPETIISTSIRSDGTVHPAPQFPFRFGSVSPLSPREYTVERGGNFYPL